MSILLFGIEKSLSRLTIWLSAGLYYAAAFIFKVFLVLSNGSVVSSDDYKILLNNFYIIIGIVMLFLITFNLLKGMVNPDDQKGTSAIKKIIINFITSLIMITLLPTIFSFAFDFQTAVLVKQNTIGRLFGFGSTNSSNADENAINQVTNGANMIVNGVWTAFFNVNTDAFNCNVTDMTSLGKCQNNVGGDDDALDDVIAEVEQTGSFFKYSQFAGNITDDEVTYNFLLSLVGGFLLLYVGISYCLDMGVRLVKLAFYQIIAPIPIMLRVIPEGKLSGSFGKWVQITVTCYLEVFIRIFVLYFCVYLCIAISSSNFLNNSVWQYGFMTWLFTKAFIFMGLITFMKQAPKLISEVTGIDSGNMKLGIREKLASGGAFTAGAVLGGGLTAGVRNASNAWQNTFTKGEDGKWHKKEGVRKRDMVWNAASVFAGTASGAARGGKSGWGAKSEKDMKASASKGAAEAVNARDKRAAYIANHGENIIGATKGHVTDAIHSAKEWAGIGVVSSTEADYYTSGANAFDSAHSQIEGTYKGKPGHNKIKERATELDSLKKRLSRQIEDMKNSDPSIASDLSELQYLENFDGPLSKEQTERLEILKKRTEPLRNLTQQYSDASSALADVKLEQSIHEAGEMSKKMSVSMEAINNLVNAKTRYFDISKGIFDDELYNILRDTSGLDRSSSADIQRLVTKIENNETILMSDLRDASGKDIVDLNSLEKFLDQAGIKAKDIAAEKRVEVAHARALKDEKKGDKK